MRKKDTPRQKKEKIIATARDMYLSVTHEGKRKYSLQEIATFIQQKHKSTADKSVISRWVKRYDWDKLFQESKMLGIENAISEHEEKEQLVIEAKSKEISRHYKTLDNIYKVLEKNFEEKKDEISKMSAQYIMYGLFDIIEKMRKFFPEDGKKDEQIIKIKIKNNDD